MLYQFVEYQRALLAPCTAWAASAANAFADPDSLLACVPGASYFAAGYEMLYRLGKTYEKPSFGITAVRHDGAFIPVVEEVVLDRAFCRLVRFAPDPLALGTAAQQPRPAVLVCAPLAARSYRSCCQSMLSM